MSENMPCVTVTVMILSLYTKDDDSRAPHVSHLLVTTYPLLNKTTTFSSFYFNVSQTVTTLLPSGFLTPSRYTEEEEEVLSAILNFVWEHLVIIYKF